ncbi:uncharacterized protein M437DRAFT_49245, partial [Aureobasidium melanogenum CBS 110374]
ADHTATGCGDVACEWIEEEDAGLTKGDTETPSGLLRLDVSESNERRSPFPALMICLSIRTHRAVSLRCLLTVVAISELRFLVQD